MTFDAEALRTQIPYYLTADPAQKAFLAELTVLNNGADKGYFIPSARDPFGKEILQGDGWRGFQVYSFTSGNSSSTRGIVLSNSCDVSAENERVVPSSITFAPIVRLSRLMARFEERGLDAERIASRLQAIRSQSVTNIFYLPADGPLEEEHVALLDDLHSVPIEVHTKTAEKMFTLSMAGFYLFVFKLSVHFCRLHENVDRSAKPAAI